MDPNIIFSKNFQIIHLIWKDGMRNPLDRPPGEGSTMFKSAVKQKRP